MRYYIKTDLRLKLGGNGFLPCLCDLQIETLLADETSANQYLLVDPMQWLIEMPQNVFNKIGVNHSK